MNANERSPQLQRVQRARTTLLLDQPFFGVLALRLTLQDDPTCDTAWTDGTTIAFSPKFVDTLSADELTAVLAHEVMHCAAGHPWRRDARDMKPWNVACDYAINHVLTSAGFRLPSCALQDPQYAGRWAEWIYDRLPQQQTGQDGSDPGGSGSGQGTGTPGTGQGGTPDPSQLGEVRDAPADTPGTSEIEWQEITKQATQLAKGQGKLPGGMQREIDQMTAQRVDWRSLLRRYVQEITRADYSWSRPNVRYLASGLFLPALHSIACGRIVVAVDTSGSIDQVLLAQFATELQAIVAEVEPSSVDVIYCDTHVHRVETFDRGDLVTLNAVGGGGTRFAPVFDKVAEGDDPAVLIYLTDLDGSFPQDTPDYPVIWASSDPNGTAPFGDVVSCNG